MCLLWVVLLLFRYSGGFFFSVCLLLFFCFYIRLIHIRFAVERRKIFLSFSFLRGLGVMDDVFDFIVLIIIILVVFKIFLLMSTKFKKFFSLF